MQTQTTPAVKTYTSRSNAKRAALKLFKDGEYEIVAVADAFSFKPVAAEVVNGTPVNSKAVKVAKRVKAEAPAKPAPAAATTSAPDEPAATTVSQHQDGTESWVITIKTMISAAHTSYHIDAIYEKLNAIPELKNDENTYAALDEAIAKRAEELEAAMVAPKNALFDTAAAIAAASRLHASTSPSRSHAISDEDNSPDVGDTEPLAPVVTEKRQYTISKNRPEANGITRPSPGTKCGDVWDACDRLAVEKGGIEGVRPEHLKEWATKLGANPNNAMIEFYQWRKHNGVFGRAK